MKCFVTNRMKAELMTPSAFPGWAVVSISVPGRPAPLREGWAPILRLEFHDILPEDLRYDERLQPFTNGMAQETYNFIQDNLGKNFFIHCDAGVSRSAAVARFLQNLHGYEVSLTEIHSTELCNIHVYNLLTRIWYREQEKA